MSISGQQLSQDLLELRTVAAGFFSTISAEDWHRHTEPHETGWTLHQTPAHITGLAEGWYEAVNCALVSQPVIFPGLSRRADLPDYIQQAIVARQHIPPPALLDKLLAILSEVADQAAALNAEQLSLEI